MAEHGALSSAYEASVSEKESLVQLTSELRENSDKQDGQLADIVAQNHALSIDKTDLQKQIEQLVDTIERSKYSDIENASNLNDTKQKNFKLRAQNTSLLQEVSSLRKKADLLNDLTKSILKTDDEERIENLIICSLPSFRVEDFARYICRQTGFEYVTISSGLFPQDDIDMTKLMSMNRNVAVVYSTPDEALSTAQDLKNCKVLFFVPGLMTIYSDLLSQSLDVDAALHRPNFLIDQAMESTNREACLKSLLKNQGTHIEVWCNSFNHQTQRRSNDRVLCMFEGLDQQAFLYKLIQTLIHGQEQNSSFEGWKFPNSANSLLENEMILVRERHQKLTFPEARIK